jgi:sugar lactone lactonase YvrE
MAGTPTLVADGLAFAEGPRWRDGRLWFSDMHGEAVHTIDADGRLATAVALPGRQPSGLGFLPDGSLLIVSMLEPEILRWDGAHLTVHADLRSLVTDRCNDMVVDDRGHAYVGSYPGPPDFDGVLVHVAPDGAARIAAEHVKYPNGTVVTDGGNAIVVAESLGRRLTRFPIDAGGALGERSVYADCRPYNPDGICIDTDGAIWVAMPLAHEFLHIAPGGEVLDRIPMGERLAIACTLGGADLRTLFLLTSLALPGDEPMGTRDAAVHAVEVAVSGTGSP